MSFPWSAASTFKGRARTRVCVRAGGVGDRGSRAGGFAAVVAAVAEATQLETAEEGQPVHRRCGQVRWAGRGPPQDLPPGAAACAGESAVGVTWGSEGAQGAVSGNRAAGAGGCARAGGGATTELDGGGEKAQDARGPAGFRGRVRAPKTGGRPARAVAAVALSPGRQGFHNSRGSHRLLAVRLLQRPQRLPKASCPPTSR